MNKEEALKKIEELKQYVYKLEEVEKEGFCVDHYSNVSFDKKTNDLVFKNNCIVGSLLTGDGVYVNKRFVKAVFIDGKDDIHILLRGSNRPLGDVEILWESF